MSSSSKEKLNLIVVAHPDDETLFFGGLVLSKPKENWLLIVATDGNADERGDERKQELLQAAKHLGIKNVEHWDFPDIYEQRLDTAQLVNRLSDYHENIKSVYTHGPIGEYGHPHHQDISYAVHKSFDGVAPVFSPAYNHFPEQRVILNKAQFEKKFQVMSKVYKGESQRFMHLLPVGWDEGFCQISFSEVNAIYGYLSGKTKKPPSRLVKLKHLSAFLDPNPKRPF